MDHIAILDPSLKLLPKILSGEKTIESRWYNSRRAPWNNIREGETVYFKNSGEPVTVKATVKQVEQHTDLAPSRIEELVRYHSISLGIEQDILPLFLERVRNKRFAIFVYLSDIQTIAPFDINKTGFGTMSAWITLPSIARIKR